MVKNFCKECGKELNDDCIGDIESGSLYCSMDCYICNDELCNLIDYDLFGRSGEGKCSCGATQKGYCACDDFGMYE